MLSQFKIEKISGFSDQLYIYFSYNGLVIFLTNLWDNEDFILHQIYEMMTKL